MKILPDTQLTFNDVLLVPQRSSVASRKLVNTSVQLTKKLTLKIPILSANMDTVTEAPMALAMARAGGLGIIHRFLTIDEQCEQVLKVKEYKHVVGAAIGAAVSGDYLLRAQKLIDVGVDVLVVDVAHGHADHVLKAVRALKEKFPNADVIAGNVSTAVGVHDLVESGADCIKVGVGPGAACSTRVVTGCGVPQLSAIMACASSRVTIIADGGIKSSGDVVKALAAGASAVMLGSMLAGTDETPGLVLHNDGLDYKIYRGMASSPATISKLTKESNILLIADDIVPEGVATSVAYRGRVEPILKQIVGGIRSGMSYCGAFNMKELQEKATFVRITAASWTESLPLTQVT